MNEKEGILAPSVEKKYSSKSRFFHHKTTGCFIKNDRLFYQKRRVVLSKTTGCFTKNDGLFYQKRQVVLPKTTGCFIKSDGLFHQKRRLVLLKTTARFSTKKNKYRSFCSNFSPCPHPILLLYKPSQGKNCANITNLRRNKSHNTK